MKIQTVACFASIALLCACSTTSQTTAKHESLAQKTRDKYATTNVTNQEPAPPAEGPDEVKGVPAAAPGPDDVDRNPILVPSPLLRYWAASRTP